MTIRWGVSPIAWSNDDLPEVGGDTTLETILGDIRDIGFEGVELGNKFPRDPALLKPIMERFRLAIVGGWYSINLLTRDETAEKAALAAHLDLLKAMGSDVFIVAETSNAIHGMRGRPLGDKPVLDAGDWKQFGRRLDAIAAHVADHGMRLAYHHHLGTVVETADELAHFLDATGDRVGLVVDTGHALGGGIDPLALVRDRPERVVHVHCKDIRPRIFQEVRERQRSFLDGVLAGMFTTPGDGAYDYAAFLKTLKGIGYSGWIVIEAEQDPALADPRLYGQLGLDTLKRLAAEAELA